MGYAIKLNSGTGKKYEVACGDLVRGHRKLNDNAYNGAKWKNNYDDTGTIDGETPESYISNNATGKINALVTGTWYNKSASAKKPASDGATYDHVIVPSAKTYELTRINEKTSKSVKAFDIVLGYYTRMNLGGAVIKYAYIDYTKAKRDLNVPYPCIELYNGSKAFSLKQTTWKENNITYTDYCAADASSPVDYYDEVIELPSSPPSDPQHGQYYNHLAWVEEITSFFRYSNRYKIWSGGAANKKVPITYNTFNGSLYRNKGYLENFHLNENMTTPDRPFKVLTKENIFYSWTSYAGNNIAAAGSNDKRCRLGFKIFPLGTEESNSRQNAVRHAPVVEIYNYNTAAATITNLPVMLFGIREIL